MHRKYVQFYFIISSHNKKLLNSHTGHTRSCNCRKKDKCSLNRQCLVQDIACKCVASTSMNSDKIYLGTAKGDLKKRYKNHTKSFRHSGTQRKHYQSTFGKLKRSIMKCQF